MTSRGDVNRNIVVRFAPSPNGLLHLGHAYAAMVAHDHAREHDGRFLLRIEDIDSVRTKTEFIDAIFDDLRWLGLDWDGDVIFQSARMDSYAAAAGRLKDMGLLYPCFCTRSDVRAAQQEYGVIEGPDGPIYPGTCRHLDAEEVAAKITTQPHSWRLDVAKAARETGELTWHDQRQGEQIALPQILGDVVLVPKEDIVAYHLAVTLDDARDDISHVVRGEDLFASTHIHRLLQALLDLPVPAYVHHAILLSDDGKKLAKSRGSDTLSVQRKSGVDGASLLTDLRNSNFPIGITLSKA